MATRKTTARTSAKKAPVGRKTAARKTAPAGMLPVSHEERWRRVAEAAYYIGQRRGFVGGDANADWAAAEAEVDAQLGQEGRTPA